MSIVVRVLVITLLLELALRVKGIHNYASTILTFTCKLTPYTYNIYTSIIMVPIQCDIYTSQAVSNLCGDISYISFSGLEFLLSNISIPTDGSGRILVTDIVKSADISSDPEALICQSQSEGGVGDWYLDLEDKNATSVAEADRIIGPNDRGWDRNRNTMREGYRVVRLKRVSDTAVEGRFTCRIPGDSDSPRGLLILHPSEPFGSGVDFFSLLFHLLFILVKCMVIGMPFMS